MAHSYLEDALLFQIKNCVDFKQQPEIEYRFAAHHVGMGAGVRQRLAESGLKDWRFDLAWPGIKFAVEIEGATPGGGRHQRFKGFQDDIEKYHAAMDMGWDVYRTSSPLIKSGRAVNLIFRIVTHKQFVRAYQVRQPGIPFIY